MYNDYNKSAGESVISSKGFHLLIHLPIALILINTLSPTVITSTGFIFYSCLLVIFIQATLNWGDRLYQLSSDQEYQIMSSSFFDITTSKLCLLISLLLPHGVIRLLLVIFTIEPITSLLMYLIQMASLLFNKEKES